MTGLYMAWTIGANDVANAMGTSVGSGALTFKRAIMVAAIFEFGGAVLAGGTVAEWTFVVVSLLMPPALCALGAARGGGRGAARWVLPLLAAALLGTGLALLLRVPRPTVLMLVGFGLVPLLLTTLGYAADSGRDERRR